MVRHGKHSSSQTENLLYILMSLEMYQIWSSHNSVTEDSSLTQPLPDQSYDQTFLKKTSIQVTIKIFFLLYIWQISGSPFYISLKKCCSYYFATEKLLPWIPTWPAWDFIFSNEWQIWLMTWYPGRCSVCRLGSTCSWYVVSNVKRYRQYVINLGTSCSWVDSS